MITAPARPNVAEAAAAAVPVDRAPLYAYTSPASTQLADDAIEARRELERQGPAFTAFLDRACRHAADAANATRHNAVVGRYLTDLLVSAMHHPDAAENPRLSQAVVVLASTLKDRWSRAWEERLRAYDPAANGAYPCRSTSGAPLPVVLLAAASQDGAARSTDVKPFVSRRVAAAERAALYDARLVVRPVTAQDLAGRTFEASLVGQRGVFAKETLPPGTCLGVYGGTLLTPEELETYDTMPYAADVAPRGGSATYATIDGDNALSRINTAFAYDRTGAPVAQAPAYGYNATFRFFDAELETGAGRKPISLRTVFVGDRPITAGSELRISYGFSPEAIRERVATGLSGSVPRRAEALARRFADASLEGG